MKVSLVNSTDGSFCSNYATDLFIYASDNLYCIFAGFQVLFSVAGMLVDLTVTITQVTVSAVNMWVTIFIVIMQMRVSVAVKQVVSSAVHYAHDCVYCNYPGDFP